MATSGPPVRVVLRGVGAPLPNHSTDEGRHLQFEVTPGIIALRAPPICLSAETPHDPWFCGSNQFHCLAAQTPHDNRIVDAGTRLEATQEETPVISRFKDVIDRREVQAIRQGDSSRFNVQGAHSRSKGGQDPDDAKTFARKFNITPVNFLNYLEDSVRMDVLLHGYNGGRRIQDDLRSIGYDVDLESFFGGQSRTEYYRFFRPLCAAHMRPYVGHVDPLRARGEPTRISVDLFSLDNVIEGENTIKAVFRISALWKPALPEIRKLKHQFDDNGKRTAVVSYLSLPKDKERLHYMLLTDQDRNYLASCGPPLIYSTTRGLETRSFGAPPFSRVVPKIEEGDLKLSADVDFPAQLLTEGDYEWFPFDRRVAIFHITAGHIHRELDLQLGLTGRDDVQSLLREKACLLSKSNDWIVEPESLKVDRMYRDIYSEDQEAEPGRQPKSEDRCKIRIEITLRRNSSSWFWQIMFPLDVICVVSFSVFLLVPTNGPTDDQKINLFVAAVTVLVAQAAFNISARPLLPKVSRMTMLDVHSTFCFILCALQAVLSAAIPISLWTNTLRFSILGGAILILLLEQVLIVFIGSKLQKRHAGAKNPSKVFGDASPAMPLGSHGRTNTLKEEFKVIDLTNPV